MHHGVQHSEEGKRVHDDDDLMDSDASDNDEPKLEIVDEDSMQDDNGAMPSVAASSSSLSSARAKMAASAENAVRIIRKSLSYDGGGGAAAAGHYRMASQQYHQRISQKASEEDSNATEAIESLLLLGRSPILSPQTKERTISVSMSPLGRRYSSSSDAAFDTRSDPGTSFTGRLGLVGERNGSSSSGGSNGVVSYYQRMRERNNEASKRCRLKRRLKAESTENQANMLIMSNKMLRQRIAKLEKIGEVIKDGVRHIQTQSRCICPETLANIRKINMDVPDAHDLSNKALIESSKAYRSQNIDLLIPLAASSDDEMMQDKPDEVDDISLQQHQQPRSLTALDIINDTIVKSLASNPTPPAAHSPLPLNLVKIVKTQQQHSPLPSKIFLLSSPPPRRHISTSSSYDEVVIKCEPEVQLIECDDEEEENGVASLPGGSSFDSVASGSDEGGGADPTSSCIAAARGESVDHCHGNMVNLNKLTTYVNLASGIGAPSHKDDSASAMERAIIKSRLGVPFWKADELPTFICEKHRSEIVHLPSLTSCCAVCNRKRAKKQGSPQAVMIAITYRISLEHYTTTGNILPIGSVVCGQCKEKHLKGVDFGSSSSIQVISLPLDSTSPTKPGVVMPILPTAACCPSPIQEKILNLVKDCTAKVTVTANVGGGGGGILIPKMCKSDEVRILVQPVQRQLSTAQTSVQIVPALLPSSPQNGSLSASATTSSDNIFTKIGRLNEALHAINPRYKPIGFSITSIESCSQSVLEDAVTATETAVSTLMSVIAPGQESYLWEAIKPKLDGKLGGLNPT